MKNIEREKNVFPHFKLDFQGIYVRDRNLIKENKKKLSYFIRVVFCILCCV